MEYSLNRHAGGFALSACIAILFNTALAWLKDSMPALNSWMASLSGHHWTTHGLFDLAVFIGLGLVFSHAPLPERLGGDGMAKLLAACTVAAGLGLLLWFLFV
ncbi:hypothetical protein [Chromobacterium alticapitis]|uniref:Uncharacterized protein n=1 Tax=Chromobacterium alticapitis TaxID=2073169 RepID=A0A2S5DG72_9NEIS|nr:hypothetical protein [Chromobacterium alticapitis]POZ61998.1 hypothetical protein C2I19_10620 [Chromobacterium alticapitis]